MFRSIRISTGFLCVLLASAVMVSRATAGERADETGVPLVVTSILPVHSLAMNVMDGVGTPVLLLSPGTSPHQFTMRPSDAGLLARARLVFWIGECGERALIKPLEVLASGRDRKAVALIEDPALIPLRQRPTGIWKSQKIEGVVDRKSCSTDSHIWLDPDIARGIVAIMVREISALDPRHAAVYAENGQKTIERLNMMDETMRVKLAPLRHQPFIVYHDAFQYFEAHYGLRAIGAVAGSADVAPGVRLVRQLRETIRDHDIKCVFTEPQFSPVLVQTLINDTQAIAWELDPIGASVPAGKDAYFRLMKDLGNSLATCLERSP